MEKKSLSKPMTEILSRIAEFEYITTTIFPEDVILHVSIVLDTFKRYIMCLEFFYFLHGTNL